MQSFKINRSLEAICESRGTRYGFRHLAKLLRDGYEIADAKCCYYNRTWERYTFESVLSGLLEKSKNRLSEYDKTCFKRTIKTGGKHDLDNLRSIGFVAKLGDIFATDQKSKNDWKARMLKAGLGEGLNLPDNWESLSEAEKQKRLDGAIGIISK